MKLNLSDIKAAVEVNGQVIINLENSTVYENIGKNEAYFFITAGDKQIKIRFFKTDEIEVIKDEEKVLEETKQT